MLSSTLSLTSALDRGDGKRHAAAALLPPPLTGMSRYPLYRMLVGSQGRSGLTECKFDVVTAVNEQTEY